MARHTASLKPSFIDDQRRFRVIYGVVYPHFGKGYRRVGSGRALSLRKREVCRPPAGGTYIIAQLGSCWKRNSPRRPDTEKLEHWLGGRVYLCAQAEPPTILVGIHCPLKPKSSGPVRDGARRLDETAARSDGDAVFGEGRKELASPQRQ